MLRAIVLLLCLFVAPAQAAVQVETVWIPMADGVRLSVDLFKKVGAGGTGPNAANTPAPVLLEYLPYRKAESLPRNLALYDYFVERGYVVARVDIRGTGQSEGVRVPHEYSDAELDDGEQVIAWLAAQPWASGKVGVFGISWGGFNAIQLALRRPPALAAIIAVDATEDLYAEDVHTIDGVWHVDSWSLNQDLDNTRPGAPDYRIDDAYFAERFDQPPWFLRYLLEQRDGPFWRRNSAYGRIEEIKVPMFLIGGWYDGYRSSIARILSRAKAPVKALIGPWTHAWPHEGGPGVAIEWRDSAVRWYDHFLRGANNGVLREPRLTWFAREWHGPDPGIEKVPGRWRATATWPPARQPQRIWHATTGGRLAPLPAGKTETMLNLDYRPAAGSAGGGPVQWWGDVAPDQRPADAASLVFDSAPLREPVEILGLPRALLGVVPAAKRANWVVRLSDVAPDGRVTLVTGAAVNGNQRGPAGASRELPRDLMPGARFSLPVDLHFTAWRFAPGHRIRFAISHAQWPMLWPSPQSMQSRLLVGGGAATRFTLPLAPRGQPVRFAAPKAASPLPGFAELESGTASGFGEISAVSRDAASGEAVAELKNAGALRFPWGEERSAERVEHRVRESDPSRASVRADNRYEVILPARRLEWRAESEITSDATHFHYRHERVVLENGAELRRRTWQESVARDFQ